MAAPTPQKTLDEVFDSKTTFSAKITAEEVSKLYNTVIIGSLKKLVEIKFLNWENKNDYLPLLKQLEIKKGNISKAESQKVLVEYLATNKLKPYLALINTNELSQKVVKNIFTDIGKSLFDTNFLITNS